MPSIFHKDELITKNGKSYPVVGARLRVAHEDNEHLDIITDVISFDVMDQAVVKATIKSDKGQFSAYGVASSSKDARLIDSLLELAETRAIARSLRFAGYGVEYTSIEEIGERENSNSPSPILIQDVVTQSNKNGGLSQSQRKAIESIAHSKHWNALEACRRITKRENIQDLDDLSKQEATLIITKFKNQLAA